MVIMKAYLKCAKTHAGKRFVFIHPDGGGIPEVGTHLSTESQREIAKTVRQEHPSDDIERGSIVGEVTFDESGEWVVDVFEDQYR